MASLVISNRQIENAKYIPNPEHLEGFLSERPDIDTLIFAFWSWLVKPDMLAKYKCYGLHTGPLLEGRGKGGSPIDNLQALGVEITTLCAFEMAEKLDAGRVVLAMPLYINVAKDHVIYRISQKLPIIVKYLTTKQPPIPEVFKRIKPVVLDNDYE